MTPIGWEAPLANSEPLSQPPPSLTTTAETSALSSIGPSASLAMDSTRRKLPVPHKEEVPRSTDSVGVSSTPYLVIGTSTGPTWREAVTIPDQCNVPPTGSGDTMEFIRITDSDHFYGIYLDLVLPIPGNPKISQVFYMNTNVLSSSNSPMTIVMIPSLLRSYRTSLFAINHVSRRFNIIKRDGVRPLDLFGWVGDDMVPGGDNMTTDTTGAAPVPLAAFTPCIKSADITEGMGSFKLVGTSTLAEDILPPADKFSSILTIKPSLMGHAYLP